MKLTKLMLSSIVLTISTCNVPGNLASEAQSNFIIANGQLNEWTTPYQYQGENLSVAIANNHRNLYVAVVIKNEQAQLKVLFSGLKISIDTLGHGNAHVQICFPCSPERDQIPSIIIEPGGTTQRRWIQPENQFIQLKGFRADSLNGIYTLRERKAVWAAMD